MDVLSEVLRVVKLESAFFFNGEFTAPWNYRSPESCKLAPYINHSDAHVIVYHFFIDGRAYARLGDTRLTIGPGDIIVLPHGDAHFLDSGSSATEFVNGEEHLPAVFSKRLKLSRIGGGGALTRVVCGYMVCEPRLSQMFLAGLPPIFKVNIREDDACKWLEDTIRNTVANYQVSGEGSDAILAKLCETLFAETLRRYILTLPDRQTGWLAGARDPEVGKALALMHREPAAPWTIADLARKVGLSRSVLAERFRQFLGEPPVSYLTNWRLQIGAQMLTSTSYSVAQIASEVGYESEQAFNRAFKRKFGTPPARFRAESRQAPRINSSLVQSQTA